MGLTRWQRRSIGPQVVGGVYRDGYWNKVYTVVHIGFGDESRIPWSDWSITCRDADGSERTHCTMWDKRDEVIA